MTPLLFDAPPQGTPSNICINLTYCRKLRYLGYIADSWPYMGSSANFRTVLSESRRRETH